MFIYVLVFLVVVVVVYIHNNKIRIKFSTFLKRGFRLKTGPYGVYLFDGKQGNFKTYSVVKYLLDHKNMKIYSNITSLQGVDYTPIGDFDDLLSLRNETDCIIVYDEIFTALTRSSKIDTRILDFLSQMRKRRIIFLTTAQEWLEINLTLRRYCRYRIHCESKKFLFFTYIKKTFMDAENMKWSNEDNEYIAPVISTIIEKPNLFVSSSYDTFEQINSS